MHRTYESKKAINLIMIILLGLLIATTSLSTSNPSISKVVSLNEQIEDLDESNGELEWGTQSIGFEPILSTIQPKINTEITMVKAGIPLSNPVR